MIWGSIPSRSKTFFPFIKCLDWLWRPFSHLFNGTWISFPKESSCVIKLITHCHLMPRLTVSGAILLLPLCVFISWTTLHMLYSFFWVIPQRLNFTCRHFGALCPIFIGDVSRKNNRREIVGVFIWDKVCLKNSLSQSEGGWTGSIRVEKRAVEGKDLKWRPVVCMWGRNSSVSKQGWDPWVGRNQIVVFQVTVSSL